MLLLTLEDQMGPSAGMSAAELHAAVYWPPFKASGRLPATVAASPVLCPIVNCGRWLVRCPFCPAAVRASRVDRRFLCAECGSGGSWLPVVWPADAADIEAVLCARPDRRTRNWMPGETVADLTAETAA
jgi:hypothetical protein